ncbi:hypothetical protein E3P81_00535 [Wallemia ichthyophaga]|nr:hypothetical protein E3P97_00537 [Wallemia ichthyophaga]TIB32415.1 hypothetical protein E3P85_01828 [Wallemia ichthyophaga]TIB50267.1 hypothetical protein E3P82_00502 [Wallemia ichthyophaga]TIB53930.1 hypothetical protein E3P81_00535 [Wallemia ichthyophaga]TIB56470.1 hypothetical protein E3P80_00502 [Wallemia ichthyophaga]
MPKAASAKHKSSIKSHFKAAKGATAKTLKSSPSKPYKQETDVVEINDQEGSDLNENSNEWNNLHSWAMQRMDFNEPLHSTNKTKVDIILRVFDNCYEYGPCVGLTRLDRFHRAQSLDMDPPEQIKDILSTTKAHNIPRIRECIFHNTDV